jgi:hypothetical protein
MVEPAALPVDRVNGQTRAVVITETAIQPQQDHCPQLAIGTGEQRPQLLGREQPRSYLITMAPVRGFRGSLEVSKLYGPVDQSHSGRRS